MRILFVSDAPSIHTRRWAEYFRDKGAEVHIASFRPFDIPDVKVHILPTFGLGKIGYLFGLRVIRRLYTTIQPDIVHAQYVTSYGFLAALAGLRPLIITAWGTDVLIRPQESRLMRFLARYAVTHASVITTVAEHMNTSIVNLGVLPEQIEAIPFGVDSQLFLPIQVDTKCRKKLKLICTRNFAQIYDVQTLIHALAKIFASGYQLDIDLVGDGPLRQSLIDLVHELDIAKYVHFHGHVDHKTLARLLADADIFVTPALSDGNNVSLNEAMSCGCFPIASDIPANSQWIRDGHNGYLYSPENVDLLAQSIVKAIENTPLRLASKIENRTIVETRADWRICVNRMEKIYERLSGKRFN